MTDNFIIYVNVILFDLCHYVMLYHVLYIDNLKISTRQPKFNFIVTTLKIWIILTNVGQQIKLMPLPWIFRAIFFWLQKITYFEMEKIEILIRVMLTRVFRADVKNASNSNYTLKWNQCTFPIQKLLSIIVRIVVDIWL
jgi:hypothetical protein